MKVLSTECYGRGDDIFELEVLNYFQKHDTGHPGYSYVSQLVDAFHIRSRIGTSVFLIFNLMAQTLHNFSTLRLFRDNKVPPMAMKKFLKQILLALDYAHRAGVIHTGMFTASP